MARVERLIAPLIVSLVIALAAAGCGGGSSGSGSPAATTSVISGSAQQGFMGQSTVQAYSVNPADGSIGMNLGSATTDSTGFFKLSLSRRVVQYESWSREVHS
jgi:Flp pilus assembly protein TadD